MRRGRRRNRPVLHLRWKLQREMHRNTHLFFVEVLGHSSLEVTTVSRKHGRLSHVINIRVLTSLCPQTECDFQAHLRWPLGLLTGPGVF